MNSRAFCARTPSTTSRRPRDGRRQSQSFFWNGAATAWRAFRWANGTPTSDRAARAGFAIAWGPAHDVHLRLVRATLADVASRDTTPAAASSAVAPVSTSWRDAADKVLQRQTADAMVRKVHDLVERVQRAETNATTARLEAAALRKDIAASNARFAALLDKMREQVGQMCASVERRNLEILSMLAQKVPKA